LLTARNKLILGCALLIAAGLLAWGYFAIGNCTGAPGTEPCTRVLFIGNSYTYVNDLPGMFARLARSGGHPVKTGVAAEGGWSLTDHATSSNTLNQLGASQWDFVVLQEQSQIPAIEPSRTASMYPAARSLVRRIKERGATPVFFVTWAHRTGDPDNSLAGYEAMQYQIDRGYLGIAQELKAPIAPVGYAWFRAWKQTPQVDLWQADGSHPAVPGTYLAACVFYTALFRQSPVGLKYAAGLPEDLALELQILAADTVLKNPQQWNLP
jgi:hypothetical protein